MRLPLPSWISLRAIAAFFVAGFVGTPIWLTWEDFLEKRGWKTMLDDTVIKANSGDYSFLLNLITSDFSIGFALASLLFGSWDVISRIVRLIPASL